MERLGVDAELTGEDGRAAPGKLARVGSKLVIAERFGDHARSKPHHFLVYRLARRQSGDAGTLRSARTLCIVQERDFAHPPTWLIKFVADPREWWNQVLSEIDRALEPVAPTRH